MTYLVKTINIFILLLLLQNNSLADSDYSQDAQQAIMFANKMINLYQRDAILAKQQANQILASQLNLQNKSITTNTDSSILIFVSFSMPKSSLIAYLKAAKKIHAALIIRGLIDNSFQKTLQRMTTLVKESGGEGVQLNPLLFKQFAIKAVPAIAIVSENKENVDVVYGDVALSYALKILRDKGKIPDIADAALQQLQDV